MQANSIRIKSWGALFTMFTTLEPEDLRMAVLRAIANPKTSIGHSWSDCLFAVAAKAADPSIKTVSSALAAKTLGIPNKWVRDGVSVWDGHKDDKRPRGVVTKEFREQIRQYLAEFKKEGTIIEKGIECKLAHF